jgi:hypothetical protein
MDKQEENFLLKNNKYWIQILYKEMIEKYSNLKEGEKTKFGVIITPRFIKALKSRYEQLCVKTNTYWI